MAHTSFIKGLDYTNTLEVLNRQGTHSHHLPTVPSHSRLRALLHRNFLPHGASLAWCSGTVVEDAVSNCILHGYGKYLVDARLGDGVGDSRNCRRLQGSNKQMYSRMSSIRLCHRNHRLGTVAACRLQGTCQRCSYSEASNGGFTRPASAMPELQSTTKGEK